MKADTSKGGGVTFAEDGNREALPYSSSLLVQFAAKFLTPPWLPHFELQTGARRLEKVRCSSLPSSHPDDVTQHGESYHNTEGE
jgi:hypothetical protein